MFYVDGKFCFTFTSQATHIYIGKDLLCIGQGGGGLLFAALLSNVMHATACMLYVCDMAVLVWVCRMKRIRSM